MADQRPPEVWGAAFVGSALCVGLVFLGVIVGLLLWTRREPRALAAPSSNFGFSGFGLSMPPMSPVASQIATSQDADMGTTSIMRTLVLPADQSVRLVQALAHPWEIEIRVIQPAGALAQFSFDSGTNTPGSIIVPAGATPQFVTVPAGLALFGRIAMGTDVMVSISGRQVRG